MASSAANEPDDANTIPQEIIDDWLKARRIIGDFIRELRPDLSQEHIEHNAAAIIARLSHANMSIDTIRE